MAYQLRRSGGTEDGLLRRFYNGKSARASGTLFRGSLTERILSLLGVRPCPLTLDLGQQIPTPRIAYTGTHGPLVRGYLGPLRRQPFAPAPSLRRGNLPEYTAQHTFGRNMAPYPFDTNHRVSQDQYLDRARGHSQIPAHRQDPRRARARYVPSQGRRVALPRSSSMSSQTWRSGSSSWNTFPRDRHRANSIRSRGYDPSISLRDSRGSRYSGLSSRWHSRSSRSNHSHPHSRHALQRSELVPRSYVDRRGREISIHSQHPSSRSSRDVPTVREQDQQERLMRYAMAQLNLHPSRCVQSTLSTSGRRNSWEGGSYGSGDGSIIDPSVYRTYSGYSSASDC
jgi:hypothetical protein